MAEIGNEKGGASGAPATKKSIYCIVMETIYQELNFGDIFEVVLQFSGLKLSKHIV